MIEKPAVKDTLFLVFQKFIWIITELIKKGTHVKKPRLFFLVRAEQTRHLTTEKNKRIRLELLGKKKKKKSKMQKERTRRGRRTRAAHPAEMRLGSNRILNVGKQEAADVIRVLRTLLEYITHVHIHICAGRVAFSRLRDATLTHK